MKPPLSHAPLLPVLLAMMCGIIVCRYLPDAFFIAAMVTCIVCAAVLLKWHKYTAVLLATVAAGGIIATLHSPIALQKTPDNIYRGTVMRTSDATMSVRAIVELTDGARCYLTIPMNGQLPTEGDIITFRAEMSEPKGAPLVKGDIDMRTFFHRNAISATATTEHIAIDGHADGIRWRLHETRDKIVDLILSSRTTDRTKEFLCALLTGDDSLMEQGRRDMLSGVGLAHILALSGLHVAIIASILSLLLLPMRIIGMRNTIIGIIVVLLWGYAAITGLSPSVTRAVTMISIAMIGHMLGRRSSTFNSLCFAAILILAVDPRTLFAPGFQLTMTAVAAICLIGGVLPPVTSRNGLKRAALQWLYVTIGAVAGTSILSIYYFHQFPIYFLIVNIPIAFILPLVLGGGIAAVALEAIGVNFGWLTVGLDFLCDTIYGVSEFAASLPGATVDKLYLPWWGVVSGYLAIIICVAAVYYRRRILWPMAIVLFAVIPISVICERPPRNECFITGTSNYTAVIAADGDVITAVTSARGYNQRDVRTALERRFADFIGRHGSDSMHIMGAQALMIDTICVTVVNDNSPLIPGHTTYAVICRGFTGDVVTVVKDLNPTYIILGKDINARRRKRYMTELQKAGIEPVTDDVRIL